MLLLFILTFTIRELLTLEVIIIYIVNVVAELVIIFKNKNNRILIVYK